MMNGDKHLLLVDDDAELREHISGYLGEYGFHVHVAEDAQAMDAVLAREPIDLVILDLMLPGEDGLSACRRLAASGGPAVIMASAAGDETNRVLGLELGADDYLPKPFSPRELLARARVVLRRQEEIESRGGGRRNALYGFRGFTYDPARRRLCGPSGAVILLTGGESSLLGAFLAKPGQILARHELLAPGQTEAEAEGRAIDLQISRLRRKLEQHGGRDLIRTHRGLGYLLDGPVTRL